MIKSTFRTKARISRNIIGYLDKLETLVNRGGGAEDEYVAEALNGLNVWLELADKLGFRQDLPGFIEQEKADIETRLYNTT